MSDETVSSEHAPTRRWFRDAFRIAAVLALVATATTTWAAVRPTDSDASVQPTSLTQTLTGTLKDQSGHAIGSPATGQPIHVRASNADGTADGTVDQSGNFSFEVPAGTVDVRMAWPCCGFFWRDESADPVSVLLPGYPRDIATAMEWDSSQGPLAIKLPDIRIVTVHVTSGGQSVAGASVWSDDALTSSSFEMRAATGSTAAVNATGQFSATYGAKSTDVNGNASLPVWATDGETFTVHASKSVNGVSLTTSATGVATAAATVELALPDPPQLLTGTLKDQSGNAIGSPATGQPIHVRASNDDGAADGTVDQSGNFSFYVPAGTVDVRMAWPCCGFFWRDESADPTTVRLPGYPRDISTAVSWDSTQGSLDLKLPDVTWITVHVTSGGEAVAGASVWSDDALTSSSFEMRAATGSTSAVNATGQFSATYGSKSTDANGDAMLPVWATDDQTFTVHTSKSVNGVSLTASAADVATVAATVELALPDPPQLLTGTLKDQSGNAIGSPASGQPIHVHASNADGSADGTVDQFGDFSFYVPAGTVEVRMAWPCCGFFWRDETTIQSDIRLPGYPRDISTAVEWDSTQGSLDLKLPDVQMVVVHVTSGGEPVEGANVYADTALTSSSFELRAATDTSPTVITSAQFSPTYGTKTTDANGDVVLPLWATDSSTYRITAFGTFDGVSFTGTLDSVPADGLDHSVAFTVPGTLDYDGEYASAPTLTSLSVRDASNSSPITYQPAFNSFGTIYSTAELDAPTDSVVIDAVASDPSAVVVIAGASTLVSGRNLVTAQVSDPVSGSARSYTIAVWVPEAEPPTSSTTTSTTSSTSTSSSSSTSTSIPSGSTSTTSSVPGSSTTTSTTPTSSTSTSSTIVPGTTTPGRTPSEQAILALPNRVLSAGLTTIAPGQSVRLTTVGFAPGEEVVAYVASTPVEIGTATADGEGGIVIDAVLPIDLEAGDHSLALFAPGSGIGFRQAVSAPTGAGSLPATGVDASPIALIAVLFLIGGGLLAVTARRRSFVR